MKILNLYSGVGGNRKLWGDMHKITAVEINPEIANIYHHLYPNDIVIIDDAHQYLLKHYREYDFIWSSPPCQSHSSFRYNIDVRYRNTKPIYPDMGLYQEIIFLQYHAKNWVVENAKPYYKPLIPPTFILQRHYFWSNKYISEDIKFNSDKIRHSQIQDLQQKYGIDLSNYKLSNKRQILRNCVMPEIGKYILDNYL